MHRLHHSKRGSVYAFRAELDQWRASRRQLAVIVDQPEAIPATAPPSRRLWLGAALTLLVVACAGGFVVFGGSPAKFVEYTPRPEAARAFQMAYFGPNPGRTQVQAGIKYYQEAVRLDPRFAKAWSGLASAHIASTWFGEAPARDYLAQAKMEAQKAAALDDTMSSPWREQALINHTLEWDHLTAERQFRKGLGLNPRDGVLLCWFAEFLLDLRRYDEALSYAKRAQDVSPRWLGPIAVAGNILAFSGNPDLAISEYRRALEIEPRYGLANHYLGRAYLAKGQAAPAIEQLRRSNELLGQVPFSMADLGYALAAAGGRVEAEEMLAEMRNKRKAGYYPAFALAEIELGLGRTEEALDWLEQAAEERNLGYYFPSADPVYKGVAKHPRFLALLHQIHVHF